jgi:hypothetical protein
MKENAIILFFMMIFAALSLEASAQLVTRTIIDTKSGEAVSCATVCNSENLTICSSNADGVFQIDVALDSVYTISKKKYIPITITAEKMLSDKLIKMVSLSSEQSVLNADHDATMTNDNETIDLSYKYYYVPISLQDNILSLNSIATYTKLPLTKDNQYLTYSMTKPIHLDISTKYSNTQREEWMVGKKTKVYQTRLKDVLKINLCGCR